LVFPLSAVVAAAVLGAAALPADARGGGGYHGGYHGGYYGGYHGGGYYGGYHGGYGYYHGYYGPYHGYYGPYHGGFYGYYRGYGWGYGGFGLYAYLPYPYFGVSVGFGYPGYIPYGVGVGAYYPAAGVAVASPDSSASSIAPAPTAPAQPPAGSAGPSAEGAQAPKPDGKARLLLLVPANAQVWFNGQPTTQTGTEREFVSPVLTPDQVYTYQVRVRSPKDDGHAADETRPINVRSNDRWLVDFTRPAPRMPEAPRQGPELEPNPASPR
jgi:uncharacterized protein (TIGR03000 family)